VHAVAVSAAPGAPPATFDDCQSAVKAAFADAGFAARHGLSAINSINVARVALRGSGLLHPSRMRVFPALSPEMRITAIPARPGAEAKAKIVSALMGALRVCG
jgi:hypothetical protein